MTADAHLSQPDAMRAMVLRAPRTPLVAETRPLPPPGRGEVRLTGFGAAAHLIAQVARAQGRRVYAFTRAGDSSAQHHALALGAVWAGVSDETPPEPLDAAIVFAPAGELVPRALAACCKGGRVVCGGIHMSDIPWFPSRCCGTSGRSSRSPT